MLKKSHLSYAKRRYIFFACITLFVFILPFIRINDAQLFLLSFDKSRVDLFFTKFDMQELYLMPFLFITLFLTIFFLTTLAGRIWCGWSCPQTIFRALFRDLLQTKILKIRKNIQNKQNEPQGQILKEEIKRYNESVVAKTDADFKKDLTKVAPIEKAPFYAILGAPGISYTPGGVRVNLSFEVLNINDSKPIKNLYAVGEATGGVHGFTRLTSCSTPDCISSAMIAAEHILKG